MYLQPPVLHKRGYFKSINQKCNQIMKVIVIGAGASLEEAIRLGVAAQNRPPLINNFASTLWTTNLALPQSLFLYIQDYLHQNNHPPQENLISQFIELEKNSTSSINIERLFEFAWEHRNDYYEGAWGDLLYGAIVNPLICLFANHGFFENGVGWRQFTANQTVAKHLNAGDLVVNLNYEPLFEMAAVQANCAFVYSPNTPKKSDFIVSKPHGSINLIVEPERFWFAEADIIGSVQAPNESENFFRGIIPPRFNKSSEQHPISSVLFDAIKNFTPTSLTFWGVGFTGSDQDILRLYQSWGMDAHKIEIIHPNPNSQAINDAIALFNRQIDYYPNPEAWASQ